MRIILTYTLLFFFSLNLHISVGNEKETRFGDSVRSRLGKEKCWENMPKPLIVKICEDFTAKEIHLLRVVDKKFCTALAQPYIKKAIQEYFPKGLGHTLGIPKKFPSFYFDDKPTLSGKILKGCFLFHHGLYQEGLKLLDNKLPQWLQKHINRATTISQLDFDKESGKQYLIKRAKEGDKHAQKQLNFAAKFRMLGFDAESGNQYMIERAEKGDEDAQETLNEAARRGKLGFDHRTDLTYFFFFYNMLMGFTTILEID